MNLLFFISIDFLLSVLALVVQKLDSAIHWINYYYTVDKY